MRVEGFVGFLVVVLEREHLPYSAKGRVEAGASSAQKVGNCQTAHIT